MDQLEAIWEKAQKLAREANDAETIQTALDAARLARELQSKEKESKFIRSAQSWASIVTSSTAAFAVIISFLALAGQLYQFHKSRQDLETAAQTSQWRDALKNISFKDDTSALSSAVQMQSFFAYPPYSAQSRSVAAMLLPCVTSGAGFDAVAANMRSLSDKANQKDLLAVQQAVVDEDWDLYRIAADRRKEVHKSFGDFLEDPTKMITEEDQFLPAGAQAAPATEHPVENQCERERRYNPLKRALACSYNADTISHQLSRLWHDKKETQPGLARVSLSGTVLENADLRGVSFSGVSLEGTWINKCDLTGADFSSTDRAGPEKERVTKLDRAYLINLTGFAESNWKNTNWWDADRVDCGLADYLQSKFPPSQEFSESEKRAFVRWQCARPETVRQSPR